MVLDLFAPIPCCGTQQLRFGVNELDPLWIDSVAKWKNFPTIWLMFCYTQKILQEAKRFLKDFEQNA